ncbi:phospholipid carrier-dependent glycosyltransferase [uncultured Deefgea sp.]|uniref:phospholipid carrier-dependent glycosyltransferase n=1 Tax=uncultured Deefgea sp. TaxID=1304914 RepID=UPI0025920316|nr:phospholipid carrier-dependent glycosyltransferase [uncultured Deefgea sp.]
MPRSAAPMLARQWVMIILLGLLLPILSSLAHAETAANLLHNADAETSSPSGNAAGWNFDHWTQGEPASQASRDSTVSHSGGASLKISLPQGDDGKLIQAVPVEPNTWYRLSAWVKTAGIPNAVKTGANLSIIDAMEFVGDIKGDQDWQQIVAWGKTGPEQKEIKVAARLGFYGSLATGTVWFDDISLSQSEPPAGAKIISFTPPPPAPAATTSPSAALVNSVVIGASLAFLLLAWLAIQNRSALNQRFAALADGTRSWQQTAPVLAFISLVILAKAWGAGSYLGYTQDVGTFSAWALDMYSRGFAGFYQPGYFADYPPGYITVLWLVGAISNTFGIHYGTPGFLVLLKMPAMLADIAGVVFLLYVAREPHRAWALIAALLWLLNPLAIVTSAFWGQVDSIFTLILAASFLMLERRRIVLAASLYAVAVLFKPQALLVGPIALIALLSLRDRTLQLKALAAAVGTFILLSLPFTISREPLWIFSLYGGTLASYNYLTLNAFNLYALLGQNWLPNETLFLGLQVSTWAWLLTLSALAAVCWGVIASPQRGPATGRFLYGAFAIFVLFFVLGPKMHERYLFPAAFMGLTAFLVIGDKRVLWLAITASITTFANTLVTLDMMTRLQSSQVPNSNGFMLLCSLVNVILLIQTLRIGYDIFWRGQIKTYTDTDQTEAIDPAAQTLQQTPRADLVEPLPLAPVSRSAWLTLAGICLLYSIAAFTYLGNFASPQKFWQPNIGTESAVYDLGQIKSVASVQYHHGLGTGEYALAWSSDGQNWVNRAGIIVDNRFAEFRWRTLPVNLPARYLKVNLSTGALQMNELALRDHQGQLLALQQISGPSQANALIDEQDKTVTLSTALNGMYFDEVYHAHSAWEILQGIDATENTHPPLGKIIIAIGVAIFGMNPFGFRFMGVTFGILMLPVFFGLSRRLLRSEPFALLATALLAVDFMHFTQTRIATIDTYGVFFILASAYWMLRFMQSEPAKNHWQTDIKSLLLCGTMFGLGAASKWIVLYHGVGLAALYTWHLWRQAQVARQLPPALPDQRGYAQWLIQTLLVSVLGFIVIPLLIYTAAYIPLMQATGQGIGGMLANQSSMLQYHSQLKATHPFSSFWYEWPTMVKPMWYYGGSEWTGPAKVSTIIAFGNPITWYLGTLAFLVLLGWRLLLSNAKTSAALWTLSAQQKMAMGFILIAGLAQFLPWAVIPRKLVFIYHFFASVPFIILALVWLLQAVQLNNANRTWAKYLPWSVFGVALILFIAYFPAISGLPVPRGWLEFISYGPIALYF